LERVTNFGAISFTVCPEAKKRRARNDSGIALANLRVNGIYYGSLGVGEVTPYRKHKRIGKYVGFSFEADGVLVDRPLDNVVFGSFLGAGQFTFVLWVTNRAYPPSASLRLEHK